MVTCNHKLVDRGQKNVNYSAELFERYRQMCGYASDRQAAMSLGVLPQHVTQVKNGTRHWPEDVAIHMAEKCGIDPKEVLVGIAGDRAKPEHRETWDEILKRLRLGQLCAVVGALLMAPWADCAQCNGKSKRYEFLTA